jgi:hypothetical protein
MVMDGVSSRLGDFTVKALPQGHEGIYLNKIRIAHPALDIDDAGDDRHVWLVVCAAKAFVCAW